ncbi:unnamed protein product, partial [Protopolystoma xenopodis]
MSVFIAYRSKLLSPGLESSSSGSHRHDGQLTPLGIMSLNLPRCWDLLRPVHFYLFHIPLALVSNDMGDLSDIKNAPTTAVSIACNSASIHSPSDAADMTGNTLSSPLDAEQGKTYMSATHLRRFHQLDLTSALITGVPVDLLAIGPGMHSLSDDEEDKRPEEEPKTHSVQAGAKDSQAMLIGKIASVGSIDKSSMKPTAKAKPIGLNKSRYLSAYTKLVEEHLPVALPLEYVKSLWSRARAYRLWQQKSQMDEEKCSFLASLVNRRFLQWLSDTGNLRQLRQLEPEITDCDHGLIASA